MNWRFELIDIDFVVEGSVLLHQSEGRFYIIEPNNSGHAIRGYV